MFKHKQYMTVKTITITEDSYHVIKALKQTGESFSELFKRIANKPLRASDVRGILGNDQREGEDFKRRVKEIREQSGKSMEKRLHDIHSRFKRAH